MHDAFQTGLPVFLEFIILESDYGLVSRKQCFGTSWLLISAGYSQLGRRVKEMNVMEKWAMKMERSDCSSSSELTRFGGGEVRDFEFVLLASAATSTIDCWWHGHFVSFLATTIS